MRSCFTGQPTFFVADAVVLRSDICIHWVG